MRSKKLKEKLAVRFSSYAATSSAVLALAACDTESGNLEQVPSKGFPKSYVPPEANYDDPNSIDPNYKILKSVYVEPYWIQALEMHQREDQISSILKDYERIVEYTFPDVQPDYNHYGVTGWQPSTDQTKIAAREVFSILDSVLDVSFVEGNEPESINVISISRSLQTKSSGLSFFPNKNYPIGMDIFLSEENGNPHYIGDALTNFDYEVLVHELGHALGLKHPFEASGTNTAVLSSHEDTLFNTAMSYTWDTEAFNGNLRPLDWVALTKFYGVNSSYNADDDTYTFSSSGGTFIIDGGGIDTISVENTSIDVTIDLRQGAHSYFGSKSSYITDINQLTISHGSNIENVKSGSGDDIIIGTNLDNVIITGAGNDVVFAGEGSDIINSGPGNDRVDFSEDIQARDTVVFNHTVLGTGFDIIYGFAQGMLGDIIDLGAFLDPVSKLFPLVDSGNAPIANFSDGLLRVVGDDLTDTIDVLAAFEIRGDLEKLTLSGGDKALIISAPSQETGVDQCMFHAEVRGQAMEITKLAIFQGNAMDIDQWHLDNFSFIT